MASVLTGAGTSSTVHVDVTHERLTRRFAHLRYNLHDTVLSVKEDLQQRTGTSTQAMRLQLFDGTDNMVANGLDDSRQLGFYSIAPDGFRIHIIDMDPKSVVSTGWVEDVSLVPKYEIPEDKYNSLEDNARKFKEKLFESRPDLIPQKEVADDYMADLAALIKVGDRCEVNPGGRRGEVKFVGRVKGLHPGCWVGIHLDEPSGKNDGSIQGHTYFACPPGHGLFSRPDKVEVGDFPEDDPFADEPDEI